MDLGSMLVSKVLYRSVPCAGGDVHGDNAVRLVTQLTSMASEVDSTTNNAAHHRKIICDALAVSKGCDWVLENLGRPAVDSCSGDYTMILAAWLGLEDVVKACLADGVSANPKLEHLGSGLYAAAFNNNESLAKLLIDHGAEVQRREGYYGDALQLAAYRGSDAVVRIIFRQIVCAKMDDPGSSYLYSLEEYGPFGGPLGAAAAAAHMTSVLDIHKWESALCKLCNEEEEPPEIPFFLAVENGRTNVVRLMLTLDMIDQSSFGSDDYTPLMAAIALNQEVVVRVLLEHLRTLRGWGQGGVPEPLRMAAERGSVKILELLLSHRLFADETWNNLLPDLAKLYPGVIDSLVERRSFRETSHLCLRADLLRWALQSGKVRIAQLLCETRESRLYVKYELFYEETVLHTAACKNRAEIVSMLLQRDETDPNIWSIRNTTPLIDAAENESVECADLLLRDPRTDYDARDFVGYTALLSASQSGSPRMMQLFQRCDPNLETSGGYTALQIAMDNENPSAIGYLLSRDDLDLNKAFESALVERNVEVAGSILARENFDPNASSSLHSASKRDARVVGLLLARKDVDPNLISSGVTPLHLAIEAGNTEAAKLLLAREDIDPNIIVGIWPTPLETAMLCLNGQVVNSLLAREDIDVNRGKWMTQALEQVVAYGDRNTVSLLLNDRRIDVHKRNEFVSAALAASVRMGNTSIFRQLISENSTLDLNYKIRCGITALLLAAYYGRESTAQCLLDMGADVDAQNDVGHTPLHAASYNGHDGVVKLLVAYGANQNLVDHRGNTPYVAAILAVKHLRGNQTGVKATTLG